MWFPNVALQRFYTPLELTSWSELVWLPVLDFSDIQVLDTRPVSPAHMFCLARKLHLPLPSTSRMQTSTRPGPLLAAAARAAFWNLSAEVTDRVLKEEFGKDLSGFPFPERLLVLVQEVLKCAKLEAAGILEQRSFRRNVVEGADVLLSSEQAQDIMNKAEKEETEKFIAHEAKEINEGKEFAELIRNVRTKEGPKLASRKAVTFVGEGPGAVDEEHLQACLPPGYYIRRDQFNGRWRVHCRGTAWSCSKSWGSGREVVCTKACLQAAWDRHSALTGQKCWVKGL